MKKIVALVISLIMVLGLCACSGTSAKKDDAGITFGVAMNSMDEFRTQWLNEFETIAAEKNVTLKVTNADNDANKQIADIESLIVQKVDLLVVTPCSKGTADPALDSAAKANIPVILIDFESNGDNFTAKYGPDMATSISMCAEYCCELAAAKGQTIVAGEIVGSYAMGDVESQRVVNVKNVVEAAGGTVVVAAEGGFAADKAMAITEDWLQAYPEMNAIFCHNDDMAIGVIQALTAAGVDMDNFYVTGTDATEAAKLYIESGELDATAGRDIHAEAADALNLGLDILAGKLPTEKKIVGAGLALVTKN